MPTRLWTYITIAVLLGSIPAVCRAAVSEAPAATLSPCARLAQQFADPPDSARPHTWWHWMNGMVTAEGITADLEAMKRVGIGGAEIFNVDQQSPAGPAPVHEPSLGAT